jgi:RHS repeat-associated protein
VPAVESVAASAHRRDRRRGCIAPIHPSELAAQAVDVDAYRLDDTGILVAPDRSGELVAERNRASALDDPGDAHKNNRTEITYFDTGWIRSSREGQNADAVFDYAAAGNQTLRHPGYSKAETDEKPLLLGQRNDQKKMSWTYYVDGALKSETEANQERGTYTYDVHGHLKTAHRSAEMDPGAQPVDVEASYDSLDRMSKVRQKKQNESDWTFTTFERYDLNGNLEVRREDGKEGGTPQVGRGRCLGYDDGDRLTQDRDVGQNAGDPCTLPSVENRIAFEYFPPGWEKSQTHFNNTGAETQRTTRRYFSTGLPREVQTFKNGSLGSPVESHRVEYDEVLGDGRRVHLNSHRVKDTFRLEGPSNQYCRSSDCAAQFTYDPRERLLDYFDGRAWTNYTLDPAGNVLTERAPGQQLKTYSYEANRLQTLALGDVPATSTKYFYDGDGNLLCTTTATGTKDACSPGEGEPIPDTLRADYRYDGRNRLQMYRLFNNRTLTQRADYDYDALDRPTQQKHGVSDPRTTLFSYLGLSSKVSQETQTGGGITGTRTKGYSYSATGRRTGMTDSQTGQRYGYGYDIHGSVSLLLNSSGAVQESYGYRPYGESDAGLTSGQGTGDAADPLNPYRYTGKRLDAASGTLDMGARRFAPDVGRFLQRDQYHGALADLRMGSDRLTQNRYALAGGNPVSFVEVDGHFPILAAAALLWAGAEIGLSLWDAVDTVQTVFDPNTSGEEKAFSAGLFAAGLVGPGGGYGQVGKHGDDVVDFAARHADQAGDFLRLPTSQSWGDAATLPGHYADHGAEFGAANADTYARQASEFFQRSQAEGLPTKIDEEGVIRAYDPSTNEFGAYDAGGGTRTYFQPEDGWDYFDSQPGSEPWTPSEVVDDYDWSSVFADPEP